MRYTRIGFASYAIASVLLILVVGVAWARSRPVAETAAVPSEEPAPDAPPAPQEAGEAAWQAECAGCHGAGVARGRSIPALRAHAVELFAAEGGRDYLVDFMLTGAVRYVEEGRIVLDETHPAYAELTDQRIAAILSYMLTSWGNEELLPDGARLYSAAEIAARR